MKKPVKREVLEVEDEPKVKSKSKRQILDNFDLEVEDSTVPSSAGRSMVMAITGTLATSLPDNIKAETYLDESVEVDSETRYKNQQANTAVMAKPSALINNISNKKVRSLTTMFGQRADVILNLLEDDSQTDGALTLIQRSLLQTMVDILPVVERSVRTSRGKRGVYQLNQCISQIRELTTDIQSLRDRGQLGASVVERVLRPAFLDMAVQVSLALTEIDNSLKSYLSEDDQRRFRSDTMEPMKKSIATFLQSQYGEVKEGVISSLS